jgi:UDP-N-acetylglucosamine acyltransferase
MSLIDSTAIIHPSADIHSSVSIGPYSIIGPQVSIGAGSCIDAHVVIHRNTRIGMHNHFYSFSSIGGDPQDKKYAGEDTWLDIGDHNTIREYCTFNRGTAQDRGFTRIGDHNWIMAYVHVAHDCVLGNQLVLANNASLAGHVELDDHVILGGFTTIHQFCVIGAHAMTSFATGVAQDVPPYVMVAGHRAKPYGINSEGLRRRDFSSESIAKIKEAYTLLYRQGLLFEEAKKKILENPCPEWEVFGSFFERTSRGIVRA